MNKDIKRVQTMFEEVIEDIIYLIRERFRHFKKWYEKRMLWMLRAFNWRYGHFQTTKLYPSESIYIWDTEQCQIIRKRQKPKVVIKNE